MTLEAKVALVTGGASGIGAAIARGLADGSVSDDKLRRFLDSFTDAFARHVARLSPAG